MDPYTPPKAPQVDRSDRGTAAGPDKKIRKESARFRTCAYIMLAGMVGFPFLEPIVNFDPPLHGVGKIVAYTANVIIFGALALYLGHRSRVLKRKGM
jgi:hypothetical protein